MAVHAPPVEEAPLYLICGFVMLKLELDMGIGVEGKLQGICPLIAEGGLFPWTIIPSLTGYLASSTSYTFVRVN